MAWPTGWLLAGWVGFAETLRTALWPSLARTGTDVWFLVNVGFSLLAVGAGISSRRVAARFPRDRRLRRFSNRRQVLEHTSAPGRYRRGSRGT